MGKLIILSNRLPVTITENENGYLLKPSEGGLATGLASVAASRETLWIGWPGIAVTEPAAQAQISELLAGKALVPVFLSAEEVVEYYEGFSNDVLWPIFHYYASSHANYKQSNWEHYRSVNQKFLETVLPYIEPDDTIWIHDYQLLLLPGLIRARFPALSIGFFLHIPFPSFELFRLLPWRKELVSGLLGADLLGFHTFNDVRHFLDTATQLLPVSCSANVVTVDDRTIVAESFPMGIDFQKYHALPETAGVKQHLSQLREASGHRRVVLSIDRLDYSKGILQRLQAFDHFLTQHPEYTGNVTLQMVVVPSRDNVPQYRELKELVDRRVGEINARYRTIDWSPVHYFYRSFPLDELSAMYAHADVCMVTPMRDGMNLVSKEYVASRNDETGVLILSEMAGASKELVDALIVNPSNIDSVAKAMETALEMPLEEQKRRMKLMRSVVAKFNVDHWVRIFMERLGEVKDMQQSMSTRQVSAVTTQAIKKIYQKTSRRIIFLDYDGTLVHFSPEIHSVAPDPALYRLLSTLTDDPANFVVIVSGRSHQNLDEWFGHLPVSLIAEHGAWQKQEGAWRSVPGMSDQWKQDILPVMETYVDRTPGAFVEEKDFALVWHYRKVETGLGELRTGELLHNLRFLAGDRGLQLLTGNKVVEIKNMEINKGKAALGQLQEKSYDFIMAVGDDHTDEDIFKALPDNALTIKVGSNVSAARFYLRDPEAVRALLGSLTEPAVVND